MTHDTEAARRAELNVHAAWCPVDDHGDCTCQQPSPAGEKHDITCWSVSCDGIGCGCWCHDDEPPQEGGDD